MDAVAINNAKSKKRRNGASIKCFRGKKEEEIIADGKVAEIEIEI